MLEILTPLLFNYFLIFFSIVLLYVVLIVISFYMTVIRLFSFFIYVYLFCAGQYKNQFLAAYFILLKELKMK